MKLTEACRDKKVAEDLQKRKDEGKLTPEEQLAYLLVRCRNEPLTLARVFLKAYMNRKEKDDNGVVSEVHVESPKFHEEIINTIIDKDTRHVAIAAPRGHAKSTLIGLFYVMHEALYQRKKNIVVVSASEDLAIKFLRDIRNELEYNQNIIRVFGENKTDKWSEKEIHLQNGTVIYAKGRGGQVRGLKESGNRPDLIVVDDLEDDELVRSELRRIDLEDWFNGDLLPTMDPAIGQIVVVGTILHQDSLLNRLLDSTLYPDFKTLKYSAVLEDGTSLWPDRFPADTLQKIKESYIARGNLHTFFMEYMNDPMPSEGATFKQEYFQYFEELPVNVTKELYIDLGGGSIKKTADDTSMVVLGVDDKGDMYVDDYVSKGMGTDTDMIIGEILRLCNLHNIRKVYIEKTVASNMLCAAIDRTMKQKRIHLVVEYVLPTRGSGDRRGNMSDGKFQRIAAMEAPFKLGVIKIRKWMVKLIEQLLAFPRGQHDDLIDALSYGYMFGKRKNKSKAKQYRPKHRGGYLNRR